MIFDNLTDEEKLVIIAEYCGWTITNPDRPKGSYPWGYERKPNGEAMSLREAEEASRPILNYLHSLHAMQEPWQCLGWEEKNECVEHLKDIVEEADCEVYFATARQRADAFLRTILALNKKVE